MSEGQFAFFMSAALILVFGSTVVISMLREAGGLLRGLLATLVFIVCIVFLGPGLWPDAGYGLFVLLGWVLVVPVVWVFTRGLPSDEQLSEKHRREGQKERFDEQLRQMGLRARSSARKRFWQCTQCGGIVEKNPDMMQVLSKIGGVGGNVTCGMCGAVHDAKRVYEGGYDLSVADSVLLKMKDNPSDVSFDQHRKKWYFRGKVIE